MIRNNILKIVVITFVILSIFIPYNFATYYYTNQDGVAIWRISAILGTDFFNKKNIRKISTIHTKGTTVNVVNVRNLFDVSDKQKITWAEITFDNAATKSEKLGNLSYGYINMKFLTEKTDGQRVVEYARKFKGQTANQIGLFNYIPRDYDRKKTNLENLGEFGAHGDWCAMFVSYCFENCNLIPGKLPHSYSFCAWGQEYLSRKGKYQPSNNGKYKPKTGDIIFFYRGTRIGHTGIVTECDGTYVYTIEGNTGNDSFEYSTVTERNYALSNPEIAGYGVVL